MIHFDLMMRLIIVSVYILLTGTVDGICQQNDPDKVYSIREPGFHTVGSFNCDVKNLEDFTEVPLFGWAGDSTALVVTDKRVYLCNTRTWRVVDYSVSAHPFRAGVAATYYCMFWTDDTIYTYLEWQNSLLRQPFLDPDEYPLRGYANDDQAMVLTNKRIYLQVPSLPEYDWKIHDYAVTDVRLVGGALTDQDALIWTDQAMYFLYGFGSSPFPASYEDGTARPLFGGMSGVFAYVATDERIYFFYAQVSEPAETVTYADSNETPIGGAVDENLAMVWTNKNIHLFGFSQIDMTPLQNGETPKGGGINQFFAHVRTDRNLYVWNGFSWNIQPYFAGERYIGGDMTYIKAIAWTDKRIYLLDNPSGIWDTSIVFENDEMPVASTFNHYWVTNTALLRTNRKIYVNDCFDRKWEIREYKNGDAPRDGASRNVLALAWANKAAYIYDAGPSENWWYDQPFGSTESPRDGMLGDLSAIIATDRTIYAFFKGATNIGWYSHPREKDDGSFAGLAVSPFLVMMWTDRQIYLCGFDIKTSINPKTDITPPESYHLYQNYPNPFNPETKIAFYLPRNSQTLLQIFNVTGQLVKTLFNVEQPSGLHEMSWDGTNENGIHAPSGIYFYRLKAGSQSMTKKLLLVR